MGESKPAIGSNLKKLIKYFLGFPGVRFFTKWSVVVFYLYKNKSAKNGSIKQTPWVSEFSDRDIGRSLAYVDEVFDDYISYSGISMDRIKDSEVLEIGTGYNFGVGLKFIQKGAERVTTIDRFSCLSSPSEQDLLYRAMLEETVDESEKTRLRKALDLVGGRFAVRSEKIKAIFNQGIEEQKNWQNCFDIIISRAVMEHVYDPDEAFAVMHQALKKGGMMIHEIDFRDHGIFSRWGLNSLTFLTINDAIWAKMTSHIGAPNRKMANYYAGKMDELGYEYKILNILVVGSNGKIHKEKLEYGFDYGDQQFELGKILKNKKDSDKDWLSAGIFLTAKKI